MSWSIILFLAFTMPTQIMPDMNYGGAQWGNVSRNPETSGYYNVIVTVNNVSVQTTAYWNGQYWDKPVEWWRGPI